VHPEEEEEEEEGMMELHNIVVERIPLNFLSNHFFK